MILAFLLAVYLVDWAMSGKIIQDASIAVDFWKVTQCRSIKLFFLTHMHTDHIQGLTPSWYQTIYCSPITKRLLDHKFQVSVYLLFMKSALVTFYGVIA
jgi:phosphoribosyl 1,2-cyclic phosphodiesterase